MEAKEPLAVSGVPEGMRQCERLMRLGLHVSWRGVVLWGALVVAGCGPALPRPAAPSSREAPASQPEPQVTRIIMEPIQVVARIRDGRREYEIYDAAGLFEEAGRHLEGRRFKEASATYDRLVREFPDSRYAVPALYNAGLAYEALGDFALAAQRFKAASERARSPRDVVDALFHLGACSMESGNNAAGAEVFGRLLERSDLSAEDRVEAMVRRGYAQYRLGDTKAAERSFREAIAFYRQADAEQRIDADFFLAMAHFYLAEIPHEEFRKQPIRLPEKQMERDLENKARLLLQAQGRYIATINVRNPHWAAAAGYQVASLYQEFYDAIIGAPIPHEDLRRRATAAGVTYEEVLRAYVDQVRQYMSPLLENAIRVHEKTLEMAERTGIQNEWVQRSSAQLEALRRVLAGTDEGATGAAASGDGSSASRDGSESREADVKRTPPASGPAPSKEPPRRLKREYFPRVTL